MRPALIALLTLFAAAIAHVRAADPAPVKAILVTGAGTWSLAGNAYTEVVTYSSAKGALGKTYSFNCELCDGKWIHTGHEDQLLIEEHWKPAT